MDFQGIIAVATAQNAGPPDIELVAPVLTQTSAAGGNPLAWSTAYTNLVPDASDYVNLRYRENGGAWITETPVLVTSAWVATYVVDGTRHPWPLYDADTFPASTLVEVQGGVTRGADATVWSNIVGDTMAAAPRVTAVHRQSAILDLAYGTGPGTMSGVIIEAGDKVVIHVHGKFNDVPQTITAVTANSGAITFTQIGTPTAAANDRVYTFYADTAGVTSLNLSIAVGGSTQVMAVHVHSVQGAAAGTATASHHEVRNITNPDPIDLDGGLSVPANGVALLAVTNYASPSLPLDWTGATENADVNTGAVVRSATATQTVNGNVTILGQPSGGPGYGNIGITNTTWSPA